MLPNKIIKTTTKTKHIRQPKTTQTCSKDSKTAHTCSRDSSQPIFSLQQSNAHTKWHSRRAKEQRSKMGVSEKTIEFYLKRKSKSEWQSRQVRSRNHLSMSVMSLCRQINVWEKRINQSDFETSGILATLTLSSSFTTRCPSSCTRYSVSKTKWTDKIRLFPSRTRSQVLHFKTRRSIQGSS